MRRWLAWLVFAACTNSHGTPTDAPMMGSGSGSMCTGAVYDPCTDNTQCMSSMCHLYTATNLQVCTQSCTAGNNTTCPTDVTGVNGTCNNMGNCKPAAANNCHR